VIVPPSGLYRGSSAVVVAHGGFEGGKELFRDQALEISGRGFTVLAADTAFPRTGGAGAVEAGVRTGVLTHRRSLDVLQTEYGVERFGFFGHSKGGSEAAILAAVEPRLDAIVIGGMGSASADRRAEAEDDLGGSEYLRAVLRFDAGLFLAEVRRTPVFIQHGRDDNAVSLVEARALFEVAAEPKEWRVYNCGHGVDGHPQARADRIAFFERHLR
jgi:predicted esterase